MSTVVIGKLRYDIISDTVSFEKGMRKSRAELKLAEKAFRDSIPAHERLAHERERINSILKKEMITQQQANRLLEENKRKLMELAMANSGMTKEQIKRQMAMQRGNAIAVQRIGILGRLKRAIFGVRIENEKMAASQRRANKDQANLGGSLGSALGFGGPGAGVGRILGYGTPAAAAGAVTVAAGAMVKAFAEVETATVDLQILMGDDSMGANFVTRMRQIAKETPLTTASLIRNAQTMLAYGQSAEGLEDTLVRLGTVSGGNADKFRDLTLAFSQVQASGRLMGQEVLQLINAGFPLIEVAKAAGVEMSEFRKAVEEGQISAEHLSQALINLTSDGGRMAGRLESQAKTLTGSWTRFKGEMNEIAVDFGEKFAPVAMETMDAVKTTAVGISESLKFVMRGFGELKELMGDNNKLMQNNLGLWGLLKNNAQDIADWFAGASRDEFEAAEELRAKYDRLSAERKKAAAEQERIREQHHKREMERIEAQRKAQVEGQKKVNELFDEFRVSRMSDADKLQRERDQQRSEVMEGVGRGSDAEAMLDRQLQMLWRQQDFIRQRKELYQKEAENIERQIEADKEKLAAIKEDERNRIKAISDWEKSMLARMGLTGGAPQGGQSFASGSAEEYKFFASEQKRRREAALRLKIEKKAADDTAQIKKNTHDAARAIEQMNNRRQAAIEQLQGVN